MRKIAVLVIAVVIAFCCGFAAGNMQKKTQLSFHTMLVNNPLDLKHLITPNDSRIKALAAELKTPENAYKYVQDQIINDASDVALPAGDIAAAGKASCLGKAILLCTLYRAMGIPSADVRIIAGEIDLPGQIIDHAWLEMEYGGRCIQQDVSNVLGHFSFDQFQESKYVQVFIRDEEFVFNDKQFALVSQLNRMLGSGHPPMQ